MGVFCEILINRSKVDGQKAGTPVSGIVRYAIDEPGRYKEINLFLIGKGKSKWYETHGNQTFYYTGKENYTKQHLKLSEKGPESDFILSSGIYENPFTFVLPNNIPSSFKSSTCTIKYKLVIKFEKAGLLSINKKFSTEIKVIGDLHPIAPEEVAVNELKKTLFTPFKKRKQCIQLQSKVSNAIYKPGDNVEVNYMVTNNTDIVIPSLKAELIRRRLYTADCGNTKKSNKTISECTIETPSLPDNAIADLISTVKLPEYLYTTQHTRIMSNEYLIKVTLRLPMPHINASMKIPIVVGEQRDADNVELILEAEEIEKYLPSYFELMNESKEEKGQD